MKNLNGLDISVFVVYMAAVLTAGAWAARGHFSGGPS